MAQLNPAAWATPLTYNDNPANYSFGTAQNSTSTIDQPGVIREEYDNVNGTQRYRFAFNGVANATKGDVVFFCKDALPSSTVAPGLQSAEGFVTNTIANSIGNSAVAGVAVVNVTKNNYGWFQVSGQNPGINADGSVLVDTQLTASGNNAQASGVADGTAPTKRVIGWATANVANGLAPCILSILP